MLCEDLIRVVYSHFSHCAKRLAENEKFQFFLLLSHIKFLSPLKLDFYLKQCVLQIIQQWTALEALFKEAAKRVDLYHMHNIFRVKKNFLPTWIN